MARHESWWRDINTILVTMHEPPATMGEIGPWYACHAGPELAARGIVEHRMSRREIDHIDGDPRNNEIGNLRFTRRESTS